MPGRPRSTRGISDQPPWTSARAVSSAPDRHDGRPRVTRRPPDLRLAVRPTPHRSARGPSAPGHGVDDVHPCTCRHRSADALTAGGVLAVDEHLDVATDLAPLVPYLAVEDAMTREGPVEQLGHGLALGRRLDLDLRDTSHEVAEHAREDDAD